MVFNCDVCGAGFKLRRNLVQHRRERHMASLPLPGSTDFIAEQDGFTLEQHQQALRGYLRSFIIRRSTSCQDAAIFLNGSTGLLSGLFHHSLTELTGLKAFLSLKVVFSAGTDDSETIRSHFNSTQREILGATDIVEELKAAFSQILLRIEEFLDNGSNWVVLEISHLDIHIARYQALRGGSTFVPLPPKLRSKHAIINVQNKDDKCFMWSVLSAIHPVDRDAYRTSKYERYQNQLNFDDIQFPVRIRDIARFERSNNIGISIFGWEEEDVVPLRICKSDFAVIVDLLLIDGHYCWIKNLDALLHDQRKIKHKLYFCRRCLLPQYSEQKLLSHYELCSKNEPTRVVMPDKDRLQFSNYYRMQRAPYVIYCDFEALLLKIDSCSPSTSTSYTTKYQQHEPCGFGLIDIFSCCPDITEIGDYFSYRGKDAVEAFLNKIVALAEKHQSRAMHPKPNLSNSEWESFAKVDDCYLCGGQFLANDKVRDHCHYCGRYRGAAHYDCNLSYRLQNKVQVVFHNLKRYDGHLIMQKIGALCSKLDLDLDCIAKGTEDYVSFSVSRSKSQPNRKRKHPTATTCDVACDESNDFSDDDELLDYDTAMELCEDPTSTSVSTSPKKSWKIVFIDSLQFLPSSLDVLVTNLLKRGSDSFRLMKQHFGNDTAMLLRKGVYPYEYMDSWTRFQETQLPPIEQFWSSLSDTAISESDYAHAISVWDHFELQDMGAFHDLYLKTDVLLLCDIFENFRLFSLRHYGLDPAHYYTLPSLGWDACLKLSNARLELLQDSDMYQFFEAGIRGGISVISHRYAKANNKHLPGFNPAEPSSYVIYLDVNNLYGTTMVQPLPVDNFHWMSREEIDSVDWLQQQDDQSAGYVLEVDLDYPVHLQRSHNDYPLAPEKLRITDNMLSPYCRELKASLSCISGTTEKLVPNLNNKRRYILHYRNLRLYLELGMQLRYINRAIRYHQAPWMAPYINFNTEMRKQAATDFEKDLFKLLNNAVFGKTMENVRQYKDVKLVTSPEKFTKLVANPRYKSSVIFDENLVAVSMSKRTVQLCKPIYVGFSVLDLSKLFMYSFHYGYMVPKYGSRAKMCLTDTDSFIYLIDCDDVYRDMVEEQHLFDTSNYQESHPLFSNQNKKVLGKMKDETAGIPIEEFVGLRPKMYSLMYYGTEKKRAKGVKKHTVAKLRHSQYRETLFRRCCRRDIMRMIRNDLHQLYTVEQNKLTLSPFDDKRYILPDGISSLAYGHADIPQ